MRAADADVRVMARLGSSLLQAALCFMLCALSPCACGEEPRLSPVDAKLLESLIPRPLIDTHGLSFVSVTCPVRSVWGSVQQCRRQGWAKTEAQREISEVTFADGEVYRVPHGDACQACDFVRLCTDIADASASSDMMDSRTVFARMRETATGFPGLHNLAAAAWLHSLGNDRLAARMLAIARGEVRTNDRGSATAVVDELRRQLAWHAFADQVHAYMVRADDESLVAGRRLLDLYADIADPQGAKIVAEIQRRHASHHDDGADRPAIPADAASWPADRQVSVLISSLDEVSERQMGQPGGIDLAADPAIARLIAIGDPAVPALIDAIDADARLTRSVHFWRDFAPSRSVVSVREAALTALMSILRLPIFQATSTGDDFTSHGDQAAHELAHTLREYWSRSGSMPLVERLRATVLDASQTWQLRREAATQLGELDSNVTFSTTVFSDRSQSDASHRLRASALALRGPSAGEAILQAMDQDLGRPQRDQYDDPGAARDTYLQALIGLGDASVVQGIADRGAQVKCLAARCAWARAADALGDGGLIRGLSSEVANGSASLRDTAEDASDVLLTVVSTLSHAHDPSGRQALMAIQADSHPLHDRALASMLAVLHDASSPWFSDSFCLGMLASKLDDTTLTENWCSLAGRQVNLTGRTMGMENLPDGINPACGFRNWWLTFPEIMAERRR